MARFYKGITFENKKQKSAGENKGILPRSREVLSSEESSAKDSVTPFAEYENTAKQKQNTKDGK